MRQDVRKVAAAAVTVGALLAGAGVSSAGTSLETFPTVRDGGTTITGGIFIRGDSDDGHIQVRYEPKADAFQIKDFLRLLKLRPGDTGSDPCRLRDRHRAICPNPEAGELGVAITVRLRGGDDYFDPQRKLATPIAADGGLGDDAVRGARGDDVLKGGPGHDRVLGRDGDDTITGSAGDVIRAGDGEDVILADYGSPEATINCGPGDDTVYVDAEDRKTNNCETVVRP